MRWTVWRGSTSTGLTEAPQAFETFGGWGAGDLVGAVAPPTGPLLVGSWESRRAGLDAAVWTPTGPATWTRQPSAGTALESTEQELVGVVSAAPDGSRVLLPGSVLRLEDGSVQRSPAVWRSQTGSTGWSRLDLPAQGSGEAAGAACASGVCTVVGRVDGQVAVWRLTDAAHRLSTVPAVAVTDADPLPPPALTGSGAVLAVPDGSGSRLLRETGDGWASLPGPPGRITALTVVATVVYAVAADPGGTTRLWTAHL